VQKIRSDVNPVNCPRYSTSWVLLRRQNSKLFLFDCRSLWRLFLSAISAKWQYGCTRWSRNSMPTAGQCFAYNIS